MKTFSQSDFDKSVLHTIRIELQDGEVLFYQVSAESKQAFQKTLEDENHSVSAHYYIWMYIPGDRLAFVNKKDITRITLCYDPVSGTEPEYIDNFLSLDAPGADLFENQDAEEIDFEENEFIDDALPQLIVMHNRQKETTQIVKGVTKSRKAYFDNITRYSSMGEADIISGFEFGYDEEMDAFELRTGQYLQFIDDDGEENFMPLANLSVIEIERALIMDDEMLYIYLSA